MKSTIAHRATPPTGRGSIISMLRTVRDLAMKFAETAAASREAVRAI